MLELFRLVRFRTIAFAAFTMYTMRYFVIRPILEMNAFSLQLSDQAFTLLVISVCCLISAAYVINDYFDTKADRISGVRNIVVGNTISRRTAISLHTLLNIIAVIIAFYLGFTVGCWEIGIFFLLVSAILWFYSSTYKRYFVLGNVIVGFLAALIPISVIVYEVPLLQETYTYTAIDFMYLFRWVFGVSFFLFLNTLMYEINKDIYSVNGDRENGILTIPVKLGISTAKYVIVSLAGVCIFTLASLCLLVFYNSWLMLGYLFLGLFLPYILYIKSVLNKKGERKFQLRLIRVIMFLCVFTCLFLGYFF